MNEGAWRRLFSFAIKTVRLLALCALLYHLFALPKDRGIVKACFFAIQTFTTTGYGSGFSFNDDLMTLACIFMIIGATMWAILIGVLVNIFWQEMTK